MLLGQESPEGRRSTDAGRPTLLAVSDGGKNAVHRVRRTGKSLSMGNSQ